MRPGRPGRGSSAVDGSCRFRQHRTPKPIDEFRPVAVSLPVDAQRGATACEDPAVSATSLQRARAGDETAFRELTEPHRRELQLHCYRILRSVQDAEDLVQETLLAAWRGLAGFEERASLRSWLYRIATNRCLNALRERGRRPAVEETLLAPPPTRYVEPSWLEPYPDSALPDLAPG